MRQEPQKPVRRKDPFSLSPINIATCSKALTSQWRDDHRTSEHHVSGPEAVGLPGPILCPPPEAAFDVGTSATEGTSSPAPASVAPAGTSTGAGQGAAGVKNLTSAFSAASLEEEDSNEGSSSKRPRLQDTFQG